MDMDMDMATSAPDMSTSAPLWGDGNTSGRINQGSWTGHVLPSFSYLLLGVSHLALSLYRARRVSSKEEFIQKHIPERDPKALRCIGIIMTTVCGLGIAWEAKCLILHPDYGWKCPLDNIAHHALYMATGFTGPLAILEANGRLPRDSARAGLILTGLSGYLLWHHHATMKPDPTDFMVHELLAYLSLAQGIITAVSYLTAKLNWVLYLASVGGVFFLQSAWMCTATINAGPVHIKSMRAAPLFVLEVVLFTVLMILIGAFCGIPHHEDEPRGEYSPTDSGCSEGLLESFSYEPAGDDDEEKNR